ncbi:MAG TPA: dynamin family protein [Syntrophomonadaceae bacterium]|nr:dynamin family protein [Syntrophomonadaceae bacterium]
MNAEAASFSSFLGYRQLVIDLTTDLKKLREHCSYLKLDNNISLIDEVLKRTAEDSFDIAIVGEFKRGKSTLINALLGMDVLPTDILPCSATLNRITYNVSPLVRVEFKDGETEEIPVDRLPEYVTKLTDESEKMSERVKEATVYYPVNYCRNSVDIIDTPGLNDDKNMTDVTLSVLPRVDAAIMVIMATSPFSEYERDFLENKLLTNDLGRVMFVVNRIDSLDDDDKEKVLKSIGDRIQRYVLQKAAKTLGEDSEEYAVYRRKLGKPKLFGISAKQALKAKINGDDALLEKSFFPVFERELERFLTEDRGAVVLQVPLNRILSTSAEILKTIEIQDKALSMKKEEFQAKYDEAMQEIKEIRAKQKKELDTINTSATEAYNNLRPLLNNYWPTLEREALAVVDEMNIAPSDLDKNNAEATQLRILNAVSARVKQAGQDYSERIQLQIEKALSKEAERLQGFETYVADSLDSITSIFIGSDTSFKSDLAQTIGSGLVAGLLMPGLGGIYTGYREGGVKGALIGGLGGFGGAVGTGMLIGVLGLPISWPVLLVAGVVASFSGRLVAAKFLGSNKVDKFKDDVKTAISQQFEEMKLKGDFTKNVREQVDSAFNALKQKIESETDSILNDTQNNLDELKSKIERDKVLTEKEKDELKDISDSVNEMLHKGAQVNQQLVAILDR